MMLPAEENPRSQIRLLVSCKTLSRVVFTATSGMRKSYQTAFEHLFLGPSMATNASGVKIVNSFGPMFSSV